MSDFFHQSSTFKQFQEQRPQLKLSLEDLFQKLRCSHYNQAILICCSKKCLHQGLICFDQKCQCNDRQQKHRSCKMVNVQSIVQTIKGHYNKPSQQIKKYYNIIIETINKYIDQLSELRQKFEREQELYGLSKQEIQMITLVNQNKMENINGKLVYKIKYAIEKRQENIFLLETEIKNNLQIKEKHFRQLCQSYQILTTNQLSFYSNLSLLNYPLNIQNLLKGSKRINITPNFNGFHFINGNFKTDEFNSNICLTQYKPAYIFSNEQLPISNKNKDQSFYFKIKAIKIKNDEQIGIGIVFINDFMSQNWQNYNRTGYNLSNQSVLKSNVIIKNQQPYVSTQIKNFPSDLICYVNKNDNNVYIIYNNQVQMKILLDEDALKQKRKCFAYAMIGWHGKIQFV